MKHVLVVTFALQGRLGHISSGWSNGRHQRALWTPSYVARAATTSRDPIAGPWDMTICLLAKMQAQALAR